MDQKQQIAARLKEANNILVTVSNNPSVDQLASCIGLTLALNKMGKHATAVFSGNVPSTIEFLQPEKTLEKDTNSLRDFIIALDKSKADKLRYKVEDKVVKIFITPYRTSISEKDLDFSQGDFNVDVVIALGVHEQTELDQAITAHGRILHDATVATINIKPGGELGTMNWLEPAASSLSELVTELLDIVDKNLMDPQMATALLTGIVAETNRFSNEKTSPMTMSISAELMGAGANQQLVATKLEEPLVAPVAAAKPATDNPDEASKAAEDGTLEIAHADKPTTEGESNDKPQPEPPTDDNKPADDSNTAQIHIDEQGSLRNIEEMPSSEPDKGNTDPTHHMEGSRMILQPPAMGGQMSASGMAEGGMNDEGFGSSDPLALPQPASPMGMGGGMPSFIPPASAATAANPLPFMPPSMTPGGALPQPAPVAPANDMPLPPPPAAPTPPVAPYTPAPMQLTPETEGPVPSIPAAPAAPAPAPEPTPPAITLPPAPEPPTPPLTPSPTQTLAEIEQDVHSPHLLASAPAAVAPTPAAPLPAPSAPAPSPFPEPAAPTPPAAPFVPPTPPSPFPEPAAPLEPAEKPEAAQQAEDLASARDAVMQAIAGQSSAQGNLEPIAALNAQPLGAPLHEEAAANPGPLPPSPPPPPMAETTTPQVDASGMMTGPTSVIRPSAPGVPPMGDNSMPPPPVPPPMMPPQV